MKYYEIRMNADGCLVNVVSFQDDDDPVTLYCTNDPYWSTTDIYAREVSEDDFHMFD